MQYRQPHRKNVNETKSRSSGLSHTFWFVLIWCAIIFLFDTFYDGGLSNRVSKSEIFQEQSLFKSKELTPHIVDAQQDTKIISSAQQNEIIAELGQSKCNSINLKIENFLEYIDYNYNHVKNWRNYSVQTENLKIDNVSELILKNNFDAQTTNIASAVIIGDADNVKARKYKDLQITGSLSAGANTIQQDVYFYNLKNDTVYVNFDTNNNSKRFPNYYWYDKKNERIMKLEEFTLKENSVLCFPADVKALPQTFVWENDK